jgi:hypothetical protein
LRSVEFSFLLASRYCNLAVSCHFRSDPSISFFVAVTEVERPDLSPDVSRLAGSLAPQHEQEHRSVHTQKRQLTSDRSRGDDTFIDSKPEALTNRCSPKSVECLCTYARRCTCGNRTEVRRSFPFSF